MCDETTISYNNKVHVLLETINEQGKEVILTGDFNFHVDNIHDRDARLFTELLDNFNLINHVREPTHNLGHTLDLVITRSDSSIVSHVHIDDIISDHLAVGFKIDAATKQVNTVHQYRSIKDIDKEKFDNVLHQSELCTNTPEDMDSLVRMYNTTLRSLLDKHAPLKMRNTKKRKSAWYNDEIHRARQKRRKLTRAWQKTPTTTNMKAMLSQRDTVRQQIDQAKSDYYQDSVMTNANDSRKLFKTMNQMMNVRQANPLPSNKTDIDNANDFNHFFINKIKKLKERFDTGTPATFQESVKPGITTLNAFTPLNLDSTKKAILSAATKSCDLDPIPTTLVKEHVDTLATVIQAIINKSLQSGKMPLEFKTAIVKPLLKKPGLETTHKNYRPLSNLAFVSKLIEQTVIDQLEQHYTDNNLADKLQSAYKKHHSTETAILHIVNDLIRSMDNRKVVCMAMLDLSAAFDTIDHDIILHRFRTSQGLCDDVINWIESYLRGRTQRVKVNDTTSESLEINEGTVQGSKFGCRGYVKYVEPLGELLRESVCSYHGYADDNSVWNSANPKIPNDVTDCIVSLEQTLATTRNWMYDNKLCLNESKTEFIVFGKKNVLGQATVRPIQVGDAQIQPTTCVRNLGVTLDSELNFHEHISKIISSCNYQIHLAWKIRKYLSHDAAIKLMIATVLSRLDYCNSVLINLPTKELKRLQKVQNSAARFVTQCDRLTPMTPILKRLHWLPVEYRIRHKLLSIVHKCVYGDAPSYLKEILKEYKPVRTLRSSTENLLEVPNINMSTVGGRAFSVAGPKHWNTLPPALRNIKELSVFKHRLKTHLFNRAFN